MNSKKIAIIIVLLLTFVFAFALYLNKASIQNRKELLENSQIELILGGQTYLLDKSIIEEIDVEEFYATLDTSTGPASKYLYTGVELSKVLKHFGGKTEDVTTIIAHGVDGYSVAYSSEEVFGDGNIYISYMEDGKFLGGIDEGGRGPFETIVLKDQFSNRRCKWLVRIEVL